MDARVVDGLDPGGEQPVEPGQVGDLGQPVGGELDEELIAHGPEEPFDLPTALRAARGGVHQLDPQARAAAQQPGIDEGRPVIDVDRLWDAPGRERRAQCRREAHDVLVEAEPGGHHRPGPVVEEAEQVGLAAADGGAVQGVADPQLVAPVGLEPAEHRRRGRAVAAILATQRTGQAEAFEVALQGPFRGRPPRLGPQNPPHLRGGAGGVLPLERRGHREHLGRGARLDPGRLGHQRLEPAGPPRPGPPVDRVPRDPDLLPERPLVGPLGQPTDQGSALSGRQLRVDHLLDQLIAEQRHPPGPFRPPPRLLIDLGHSHSSRSKDHRAERGGRPRCLTRGGSC